MGEDGGVSCSQGLVDDTEDGTSSDVTGDVSVDVGDSSQVVMLIGRPDSGDEIRLPSDSLVFKVNWGMFMMLTNNQNNNI